MADRFPPRRRAEQFARLVDGDESARDIALAPLVGVVSSLQAVPAVQPREQFRDSLRASLMEAAAVELVATPPEPPPRHHRAPKPVDERRRRKLVAVAGSLVLVGGISGVAAASQQALPGDALYPVKRGIEKVELTLAGSQRAEGRELLEQAEDRLTEAHSLAARSSDDARVREDVTQTLQQFTTDAGRGGDLLIDAYRSDGDDTDLMEVRTFTTDAADRLSDLAGDVPGESEPALRDAVSVIESLDAMALRACPDCTSSLPALDLDLDLLSLPQAGDADYLAPGDAVDSPVPQSEQAAGDSSGSDRADRERPRDDRASPDSDDSVLPLPDVPDEPLDQNDPSRSPSPKSPGGDILDQEGPVLGDGGVLGNEGPVLSDNGLAGTDGPLLGDEGLLGSDGPVRREGDLLGSEGLLD